MQSIIRRLTGTSVPTGHPSEDVSSSSGPAIPSETITTPNAVIHLSYDPNSPPARVPNWTRFICISDTHSNSFQVPDGDCLLHSGDLSGLGRVGQLKTTVDWLCTLPHPKKIVIAGNHDLTLDTEWYKDNWSGFHRLAPEDTDAARDLLFSNQARRANIIYLEYEHTEVQFREGGRTWKIYGSPGSPWFGGWAFNYDRGEQAEELHSRIPQDTDILLTHGPPSGILDETNGGESAGCEDLMARLSSIKPVLHVFGHIHEAHGAIVHQWNDGGDTIFVNAANQPAGKRAADIIQQGLRPSFGGLGFQPVIVDIHDLAGET